MKSCLLNIEVLLLATLLFSACKENSDKTDIREAQVVVAQEKIQKSLMSFLYYQRDHLLLAGEFTAYDTNFNKIGEEQFLQMLSTGAYLPLRLNTGDAKVNFKMVSVDRSVGVNISPVLSQVGKEYYGHYKREGTKFPAFNFIDVNGETHSNETTRGKILVLKCWFIHCHACVAEFPELNQMVKQYSHRNDVQFLSVAFDSKKLLVDFLQKKHFEYKVLPVPKEYISNVLNVSVYPTHFIVNETGIITKVSTNANEIISVLHTEIKQKDSIALTASSK